MHFPEVLQMKALLTRVAAAPLLVSFVALGAASAAPSAHAAAVTWYFDLPATGLGSVHPPYPIVAQLRLEQMADGVQFTLTPNWNGAGVGFKEQSRVERVDYVFSGSGLTDFSPDYDTPSFSNSSFRWDSGARVEDFDFLSKPNNMDAGYASATHHIVIDFFDESKKKEEYRFDKDYANSVWTVLGTTLAQFTGTQATANNKPSPTKGIISVSAYALDGFKPTPSNWVQGPEARAFNEVPEPALLGLLGAGLLVLGWSRRRMS